MDKKYLIIGIDGFNKFLLNYIFDNIEGKNFKRLKNTFFFNKTQSVIPVGSLAAWLSILSGQSPARHSVFGFKKYEPGSYNRPLTDLNFVSLKTIVDYLDKKGLTSGTINIPGTYPNKELKHNFVISGILAPQINKSIFYPRNLYEEIQNITGGYLLTPKSIDVSSPEKCIETLKYMIDILDINDKSLNHCLKRFHPNFIIINFFVFDSFQHYFWNYFEPDKFNIDKETHKKVYPYICSFLNRLDQILGYYIDYCENNNYNLIVMSDHGMAGIKSIFCINNYLKKLGYLNIKSSKQNIKQILKFLKPLYNFIQKFKNISALEQKSSQLDISDKLFNATIDWNKTSACHDIDYFQGLYINLMNREPNGIIEKNYEYEFLRDKLIKELLKVQNNNGVKVFKNLIKREEYYCGPHVDDLPDLLFMFNEGFTTSRNVKSDFLFEEINEIYSVHSINATFFAKGPDILLGPESNNKYTNFSIMDVTPNILNSLGIDIPDNIDGNIHKELFKCQN